MAFGSVVGSDSVANASPGTGITCPTGFTVAVGNLVVVIVGMRGSVPASASIADGLGNTYTPLNTYDAGNATTAAWYSIISSAGTCVPAITHTSSSNDEALIAVGFEGPFDPGGALDKDVAGVTDTSSPFACPATGILARAEELIIGYGAAANGMATFNASSPMSMRKEANSGTGSNTISIHAGSWVTNVTDSVAPEFTGTNPGSGGWKTISFKGLPPVVGITDESTEAGEGSKRLRVRSRRFADSVEAAETFYRPGTWVRPIAETTEIQYDRKRLLTRVRRFADPVNTNEAPGHLRTIFKWRSHSIEAGETHPSFRTLYRVIADATQSAEALAKTVTRSLPQLFVAWFELQAVRSDIPYVPAIIQTIDEAYEAVEAFIAARLRTRILTTSVESAETRSYTKILLRILADAVQQAETKIRARVMLRRRAASVEAAETFKRARTMRRRFADTVEGTETRILTVGKHVVYTAAVQAAELLRHVRGRKKITADSVQVNDAYRRARTRVKRWAEQISLDELRVFSIGYIALVNEMMRLLDNPTFVSTLMFLRPTLTYTSGNWMDELGGGIDIHRSIDEEAPSDADWIVSSSEPVNDITVFNLIGPQFQLIEPASLRIRARAATPNSRLTMKLFDGETEILTREVTGLTQDYQTIVYPLTGADFTAFRDATERRVMLIANHV